MQLSDYKLKVTHSYHKDDWVHDCEDDYELATLYDLVPGWLDPCDINARIVEVLYQDGSFSGIELETTTDSWNSNKRNTDRKILLPGQQVSAGYGAGNDDYTVSHNFTFTIERVTEEPLK